MQPPWLHICHKCFPESRVIYVTVFIKRGTKKPQTKTLALELLDRFLDEEVAKAERGSNFQQKKKPVNPIEYLQAHGIKSVFRFLLTHPDMDHMGGIKALFEVFSPSNFWDTDNSKEMGSFDGSPYNEEDWKFYKGLRDKKPKTNPNRLIGYSGEKRKYLNQNDDDTSGGDYLHILAPTKELVSDANDDDDYHKASYVLLYRSYGGKIVFGGDSHDDSWAHVLEKHKADVTDIDLLIAPHHGRSSGRSYDFLDVLKPKLTFFGNAKSEHFAYSAWNNRKLPFITNNQANCIVVNTGAKPLEVYVTNETFARSRNKTTWYSDQHRAWYLCDVK